MNFEYFAGIKTHILVLKKDWILGGHVSLIRPFWQQY